MLMNFKKLLIILLIIFPFLNSCSVDDFNDTISLEELITSYDLWYVDLNRTQGEPDVPFLLKAFTISFINGKLYANNNLVDIGSLGNGFGLQYGFYNTRNGYLEIDHDLDGKIDFEVFQESIDEIVLKDTYTGTLYYLVGYQRNEFDYDAVFYDNIEYFLQEYIAWEKTYTSPEGEINEFDAENFLAFIPENINKFLSSQDEVGTDVDLLYWDYEGEYEVFDVEGVNDEKILTLDYDFFGKEEFILYILSDEKIELYHAKSGTTYRFTGRENIRFKNSLSKQTTKKERKRFKVKRKTKKRIERYLK